MYDKSKAIRNERMDKHKLLRDFKYIIESVVNSEFKRNFLNRFVDSWIGSNNNGYVISKYWSKKAILSCLHNKKLSDKKQSIKLNTEHLIPKVFFEDIFIDFNNFEITNKYYQRASMAYTYFNELKNGFEGGDEDQFLMNFFDQNSIIVTLTENEHKSLRFQNEMPHEFFLDGNQWIRYKYQKQDTQEDPIEVYEADSKILKSNARFMKTITFESLLEKGVIKKIKF